MPSTNTVDVGNAVHFMILGRDLSVLPHQVFELIFMICELRVVNYEVRCVLKSVHCQR